MTARLLVTGTIAPRSQPAAMRVRGTVVEPTREPIVAIVPCRWCGARFGCDCLDWLERMALEQPREEYTDVA